MANGAGSPLSRDHNENSMRSAVAAPTAIASRRRSPTNGAPLITSSPLSRVLAKMIRNPIDRLSNVPSSRARCGVKCRCATRDRARRLASRQGPGSAAHRCTLRCAWPGLEPGSGTTSHEAIKRVWYEAHDAETRCDEGEHCADSIAAERAHHP
jgi:hypothetical protein